MLKVALTMIVPMLLGMMWRRTIRVRLPPMTFTACTYSRWRSESACPRISRAGISHETKAMTKMNTVSEGRKTVARTMARKRTGMDKKASTIRIKTGSSHEPKKPEMAP